MKIGIVGMGVIGGFHLEMLKDLSGVSVVAICDTDKKQLNHSGVNTYTDYKEMLEKETLDVVQICTPHHLHSEMVIEAAKKGINVLCEKPLALTYEEGKGVLEEIKKYDVKVGVIFQNRYNTSTLTFKEYIDSEKLGKLRGITASVYWYRDKSYYLDNPWRGRYATEGGGVLINQSIHTIDIVNYLGGGANSVIGSVNNFILCDTIEVEDSAQMFLEFPNGVRGHINVTNGYVKNQPVNLQLDFEGGSLVLSNNYLLCYSDNKVEVIGQDNQGVAKKYYGSQHLECFKNFYKAITTGGDTYITYQEGIKVLEVLDGLRKSSKENRRTMLRGGL